MHEVMGAAEGGPPLAPGDDYFLMPFAIHAVAEGDHELWDGAINFTPSKTLRYSVGDRVRVRMSDVWLDGVIIRQPANDGQHEAYDVKLCDGRRVLVAKDEDAAITAGGPRLIHHFELVFGGCKVRNAHDEALGTMGVFGRDVQLASAAGPPEICGRCVHQLAATVLDEADDALYAATVEASASLLGVSVPDDWRETRRLIAMQHAAQAGTAMGIQLLTTATVASAEAQNNSSKRGRQNDLSGHASRYRCPVPSCSKAYASSASLYQHKRTHHPELLPRPTAVPAGKRPRGRPPAGTRDDDQRFGCPAPGCAKVYASSAGLYQHKRAHHPEMIKRRR